MKHPTARVLPVVLALLMLLAALFPSQSFANDEIKKKERELEEYKQQLKVLQEKLSDNEFLRHETNKRISETNLQIQVLESEIDLVSAQIRETEDAILVKTEELKQAEAALDEKKELLNDRLRVMYKTGYVGYAEVLFGAESFHDLLSRVDMLQRILDHDQQLVLTLKQHRDLIEVKKKELEEKKTELADLVREKLAKQDDLKVVVATLSEYTEELLHNAAALKEQEEKLVEESEQVARDIQNMKLRAQYVGGELQWPVPGWYSLSDDYGMRIHPITGRQGMHTGIDIPANMRETIVASQSGTVLEAKWRGTYGIAVVIDHGGGIATLYAHLDEALVSAGDVVEVGQRIGLIGSTGYSTGPHLHFEVRKDGKHVDPKPYVMNNR